MRDMEPDIIEVPDDVPVWTEDDGLTIEDAPLANGNRSQTPFGVSL